MADQVVVPADIAFASNINPPQLVTVGEAVDIGEFGRYDAANRKYRLADSSSAANADCRGMFLSKAATDEQALFVRPRFLVDLGFTPTVTEIYVVSDTPGKIKLYSDLTSTELLTIVAFGSTSDLVDVRITATGVPKP